MMMINDKRIILYITMYFKKKDVCGLKYIGKGLRSDVWRVIKSGLSDSQKEKNFKLNLTVCHPCCVRSIIQSYGMYTGCNRRNGPDFGRAFLMLNYTEKPQTTYIQSWTVWEIMASEVWNFDSCYTLTNYQIRIETGRNCGFCNVNICTFHQSNLWVTQSR